MVIKKESIKDFSDNFKKLEGSIKYCNYNILLNGRIFDFGNDGVDFSLDNLRQIYFDKVSALCTPEGHHTHPETLYKLPCVNGSIEISSYEKSISEINTALSFDNDADLSKLSDQAPETIEKTLMWRRQLFWKIVEKYFDIGATTQVLLHIGESNTFFGDGIMWDFCIIYINDNSKKALVLSGCAFD